MSCKNDGYPFDLDGSLRFTRLPTVQSIHPYPQMIGAINGVLPLMDVYALSPVAPTGFGADVSNIQNPVDLSQYMGVMEFPTLQKVKG